MVLPITLTFAAAAALLNIWLAMRVGRVRQSQKVLHGDGGNSFLIQRMRAQANFVEYTPFVLILTGVIELALGSQSWLWILVLLYIIARVLHAFGMDSNSLSKLRMVGIITTFLVTLILAATAVYAAYGTAQAGQAPVTRALL